MKVFSRLFHSPLKTHFSTPTTAFSSRSTSGKSPRSHQSANLDVIKAVMQLFQITGFPLTVLSLKQSYCTLARCLPSAAEGHLDSFLSRSAFLHIIADGCIVVTECNKRSTRFIGCFVCLFRLVYVCPLRWFAILYLVRSTLLSVPTPASLYVFSNRCFTRSGTLRSLLLD